MVGWILGAGGSLGYGVASARKAFGFFPAGVFFGVLALYCFDPVLFAVVAFYSIAVLFILYDCSVIHSKSRGI